jgi:hypothetical protein
MRRPSFLNLLKVEAALWYVTIIKV